MFISAKKQRLYESPPPATQPAPPERLERRDLRYFWALIVGGFAVLVALGAGNTWDGSYLMFRAINDGKAYVPHGRATELLLQWPCIVASHLTDDVTVLRMAYSITYAALPVVALAVCWWITRRRSPWLFVWPALCIALVTLPGQIDLAAEANIPAQLFWPLLIALLAGASRPQIVVVALLGLLILFAHPFAVLVFGFGVAIAALLFVLRRPRGGDQLAIYLVVVGLFVASLVKYVVLRSTYDSDQISPGVWGQHWQQAIAGRPLLMLLIAALLGVVLLGWPYLRHGTERARLGDRLGAAVVALCCLAVAVVGAGWAINGRSWGGASDFRTFIGPISVLAMLFAVADALRGFVGRTVPDAAELGLRRLAALSAAGAFALVVVMQAATWNALSNRLAGDLAAAPSACVPVSQLPWTAQTAFGHWSVTTLSMQLQGRSPNRLVVSQPNCAAALLPTGIPIDGFDRLNYRGGWFHLQPLRAAVINAK